MKVTEFDEEKIGLSGKDIDKVPAQEKELAQIILMFVRNGFNKAMIKTMEFISENSEANASSIFTFCSRQLDIMQEMSSEEYLEFRQQIADELQTLVDEEE